EQSTPTCYSMARVMGAARWAGARYDGGRRVQGAAAIRGGARRVEGTVCGAADLGCPLPLPAQLRGSREPGSREGGGRAGGRAPCVRRREGLAPLRWAVRPRLRGVPDLRATSRGLVRPVRDEIG